MTTDLSQLCVLVTGASSGFGEATARRFAAEGARVIVAARREERLRALAAELGERVHALPLDVSDRAAVEAALSSLPEPFHEVDVLVNNAGLALGLEPAHRASLEHWERMIATNVRGLLYVTRALLPGMVARERGHVVNLSSVAGIYPYPGANVYGATKAFVTQLSLNLRADLIGHRVRVTDIEPGLAQTEFSLVRFEGDLEAAERPYRGIAPLRAEDVAEAVVWAVRQPPHVNVNRIELMPVMQAFAGFAFHRSE
ncbi:MAG TPA: SDR family oxidoreductase [Sandaracinaceae bacterium]